MNVTSVRVEIVDVELDLDALEVEAVHLRRELLDLDVEDVTSSSGKPPEDGTRSGGAIEVAVLVVTLLRSPALIRSVADVLQGWIARRPARQVIIKRGEDEFELNGLSRKQTDKLIDWVARPNDTD